MTTHGSLIFLIYFLQNCWEIKLYDCLKVSLIEVEHRYQEWKSKSTIADNIWELFPLECNQKSKPRKSVCFKSRGIRHILFVRLFVFFYHQTLFSWTCKYSLAISNKLLWTLKLKSLILVIRSKLWVKKIFNCRQNQIKMIILFHFRKIKKQKSCWQVTKI